MTYLLESWQVDALRDRKKRTGRSIAKLIADAIQIRNREEWQEMRNQTGTRKNYHLVRISVDRQFGVSSAAIRDALTQFFSVPGPEVDHAAIEAEKARLDEQIAAFFRSYQGVPYILTNEGE